MAIFGFDVKELELANVFLTMTDAGFAVKLVSLGEDGDPALEVEVADGDEAKFQELTKSLGLNVFA